MTSKECNSCKLNLPIALFDVESSGYVRNKCHSCRTQQHKDAVKAKQKSVKIIPTEKMCTRCVSSKPSSDFNKSSLSNDGLYKFCRKCFKEVRHRTKEEVKSLSPFMILCVVCKTSKLNSEFKTSAKSTTGHYKTCNSCWKPREWNSDKQKLSEKKYVTNNPEKLRAKWRKSALNPTRIIRDRLNHRIADAMRANKTRKDNTTSNYTGCTMPYLKRWLEFQFTDTIGWHNYGEWHIDHVIPCSTFDLTILSDQQTCFNWKNLRPCLKEENMTKGDKIIDSIIEEQKEKVSQFLKVNPLPTLPGDREEGAE